MEMVHDEEMEIKEELESDALKEELVRGEAAAVEQMVKEESEHESEDNYEEEEDDADDKGEEGDDPDSFMWCECEASDFSFKGDVLPNQRMLRDLL